MPRTASILTGGSDHPARWDSLKSLENEGVSPGFISSDFLSVTSCEPTREILFCINSTVPDSDTTNEEARTQLGQTTDEQVLLFFGNIAPYSCFGFLGTGR